MAQRFIVNRHKTRKQLMFAWVKDEDAEIVSNQGARPQLQM